MSFICAAAGFAWGGYCLALEEQQRLQQKQAREVLSGTGYPYQLDRYVDGITKHLTRAAIDAEFDKGNLLVLRGVFSFLVRFSKPSNHFRSEEVHYFFDRFFHFENEKGFAAALESLLEIDAMKEYFLRKPQILQKVSECANRRATKQDGIEQTRWEFILRRCKLPAQIVPETGS